MAEKKETPAESQAKFSGGKDCVATTSLAWIGSAVMRPSARRYSMLTWMLA